MPFPSNSQFVPVLLQGAPVSDPVKDVSPDETDIVGSSQYPAVYYAYDGTNVYFRIRLNADPRAQSAFKNFIWGVLFDTDNNPSAYEWALIVNGKRSQINLIQNPNPGTNSFSGGSSKNDDLEDSQIAVSRPIVNYDLARAKPTEDGSSFGGDADYFIDFFIDKTTLFSQLKITDQTALRFTFFTSANSNKFNKDTIGSGTLFSTAFSDPLTIAAGDIRAKLTVTQTAASGTASITTGQPVIVSGTITVSNTGLSGASTIFVNAPFLFDKLITFLVTQKSAGTTVFSATTNTLTWNIGNLGAGASATLAYTTQGIFNTAGVRTLDTKTLTGTDLFTGGQLAAVTNTATVTVTATGCINGTVLDKATGLPLTGVTAQLVSLPANTAAGSAVTGDGGVFSFPNLPAGSYQVTLSLAGYQNQTAAAAVTGTAAATIQTFLQPLPATVQGTVTNADTSAPVANAAINVTNWVGVPIAQTTTNATGQYTLTGLLAGYYRVSASAANLQHMDVPVTLGAAETRTLNFALKSNPGAVAGTITSTGGAPLANVLVEALDNRNNVLATALTDALGSYRIDTLAPATNDRLRITDAGFITQVIGFQIVAGGTTIVNAALSPNSGGLTGAVTDIDTGASLPGTSIRVFNSEGLTVQTAVADAAGGYTVTSLSPGSYSLVFAEEGYASRTVGATVTAGTVSNVSIALARLAGAVSGIVTDLGGTPLPDTVIRMFSNNIIVGRVNTKEDGSYIIPNLSPGTYILSARTDGFGGETLGVIIEPSQTTPVNIRLTPNPGSITGIVRDGSGNPIAGALVAIQNNVDGGPVILTRVISTVDGTYIVNNLQPGNYIAAVSADGYQNQFAAVQVSSDGIARHDFSLAPSPGIIQGTVTEAGGTHVFGAAVEIRVTNANGITVFSLFTDPNGRFEVDNLAPGTYTILASSSNFQTAAATTMVRAAASSTLSLVLLPDPGAIQGRVTDSITGAGIIGAAINILDQNTFLTGSTITDSSGNFRVSGLSPGNYSVIAQASNYQSNTFGGIVNSNSITPVDFALQPNPGTINGVVQPAVAGAVIQLFNNNNVQIASTISAANGAFQFISIQEGSYFLTAVAQGYSSDIAGAAVLPGQIINTAIHLVAGPGSVSGRVTDPAGSPIPPAVVKIINGNESIRGIGQSSADGTYFIDNLPAGTLSVIGSAPNFSNAIRGAALAPGEQVTGLDLILIPDPGAVSGQITNSVTGQPIGGADVEIRILNASGISIASVSTSPFGNFLFTGLQPGTYTIIARADGFASNTVGAVVISNETVSASIALLPAFGQLAGRITDSKGMSITANNTEIKLYTIDGALLETQFSDSDGNFLISNLTPGEYILTVVSPGYTSLSTGVTIANGLTTPVHAVLTLQPAVITGTVRNALSGNPISGALINSYDIYGIPLETTSSDERGSFILPGLPSGNLTLSASAPAFGTDTQAAVTRPGLTVSASFTLSPNPGRLVGFLSDFIDGANLAGGSIRIYDAVTGILAASIVSGTGGSYLYSNLAPGAYTAIASANGYANQIGGFDIVSDQTTRYSFALDRLPGRINGIVINSATEAPLGGVSLALRPFNNFGPVLETMLSDNRGSFDLGEVPAANYVLTASLQGFVSEQTSAAVTPGQQSFVIIRLQQATTSIGGIVTDKASGAPLPDSLVIIVDDNGVIGGNGVTDNKGEYTIPSAPGTNQTAVVSNESKQINTEFVSVHAGQQPQANVKLDGAPSTITGVILDNQTAQPIPGAIVSALESVNNTPLQTAVTDGEGRFRIDGLGPASYTLTASSPLYGSSARGVHIASGSSAAEAGLQLNVHFGTLRGTIRDTAGQPLFKALAEIVTPEQLLIREIISNAQGQYVLTNLSAEIISARFSFPGKQTAVRTPAIPSGGTTILDVVLLDEDEE
ncbi:carboxypeptidase regulatory-like domain-containing protein [Paenibacillus oenotherae]|uniref:Carboxypeptidase regulatory-like domain-containing protein n=1 Tax=Paenibacillus oenotherae TaxID=1435645 RepID=A0ABS7D5M8_9BACL|nr:carboxypeptidase regulatory-like domain-containing protein [Paenibacillus oenotherae]MBW7474867.1 carboxypeptidase regulatory-like domain-containing protein [Paenibacillus oenotherae]